jgi:ABC-type multidrug transport system fused ATPase/permease subunit
MEKNEEIFRGLTDELYESRVETQRVQARYTAGLRALQAVAPLALILVGAWRIAATAGLPEDQRVTAGSVVACLGYVWRFFFPMEHLAELYNHFLHSLAALDRVLEVFDTQPEVADAPDALNPPDFEGEVGFEGVTFWYNPGAPVLREVSFRVRPGEVVALVGPTGAGKTTICRLIARFYDAQQGAVRIDGCDVRRIAQAALHRRTGLVLQENFLFAGTVLDNIRYGRPSATDVEVIHCARQIGSHAAIEALPQGYQTQVGERGQTLSAGQRQLICFTRAMLADPRILILDEATSSVDTATELRVQEAIRRLTERRTSFIVAHRLSTVRRADRVLVIEGGRITEEGTHRALLAAGGRYARMYWEFIRSE